MAKAGRPSNKNWVSASVVAAELGVSARHISRLRETGRLKQGEHWQKIVSANPHTLKNTYRYELNAILKFWREKASVKP